MTKPVPVRVPRTLAAALPLLERFSSISAAIAAEEATRTAELAIINAASDEKIAPRLRELGELRDAIELWWQKDAAQHLTGKRKTAELGGCTIGSKTGAAKVAYIFANDEAAIAALRDARLGKAFVRMTSALNRSAIAAKLKTDKPGKLAELGFRLDQDEQFVLAPIEGAPIGKAA